MHAVEFTMFKNYIILAFARLPFRKLQIPRFNLPYSEKLKNRCNNENKNKNVIVNFER